jgi:hypothetical protein
MTEPIPELPKRLVRLLQFLLAHRAARLFGWMFVERVDAEGDLANWRRSPLRPLLEEAAGKVAEEDLAEIAKKVNFATK